MRNTSPSEALDTPAATALRGLQAEVARATAALWAGIADALRAARGEPWEWVPGPIGNTSPRARDLAERACTLELAVALRIPESTVRLHGYRAATARARLPQMWAAFATGTVDQQHLRVALEASEPLDDLTSRKLDAQLVGRAATVSATTLRRRARILAERLNRRSLTERHRDATIGRRVWIDDASDGMSYLTAFLPTASAHRAKARIDGIATDLATDDGEHRTRDQIRADVFADLLTGDGTPDAVRAIVAVTVPITTLLGRDELPATLDGVVPIDADTARTLCADAPFFYRVLTDPIRSTVVDVDRRSYRPPADLGRFVRLRDRVCTCPGCRRSAARSDLDHVLAWADGGSTSAANLAATCPPHHRLKHETRWSVHGEDGRTVWTSPNGITATTDPPPPPDPPPF